MTRKKPDKPTDVSLDDITDEELSGPRIDRRTAMKLLSAAGLGGLAGCAGSPTETEPSGGSGGDTDTESPTAEPTAPPEDLTGGRASVIWNIAGINNLDPAYADHGHYVMLIVNIFNGLIKMNRNFEFVPDLAEDWEVDGTKFTFHLREDVTFHNGDEFTAEDVKFTLTRNIQEQAPAASFIQDSIKDPAGDGVVVQDDYTVDINWKEPTASGMAYMTRGPGRVATIINENALDEMGHDGYTRKPVGTGPFKVTQHVTNESITLDRFDDYFETDSEGTSLPYLDGIDLSIVPEASTATSAISSGDVDLLNVVPGQSIDQLKNNSSVVVGAAPQPGWFGLEMNMTKEPFSSRQFRRGIAKLLDQEQWVENALFGNAIPDTGPLSPVHVWREDKPSDQDYAPEEGKQLIRDSGYEGAEFEILARGNEVRQAKVARQQLNASGVVNVEVNQVPVAEFGEQINGMTYDTWIGGQLLSVDPELSVKPFYMPDGIWNWSGYDEDDVTEILQNQSHEMDRETREEMLMEVEDKVIADAPHAFLCHPRDWMARRKRLKNMVHPPVLRVFHQAYLDE